MPLRCSRVLSAIAGILMHIQETYAPAGGIYIAENGVATGGEDDVRCWDLAEKECRTRSSLEQ